MEADPQTPENGWLFRPQDPSALAVLRILVGGILVWDISRYLVSGWISHHFLNPPMLFKYFGFAWVHPLPPALHHAVFYILLVCAVGIAVGAWYRLCAIVFFFGHAYMFLLASSYYLNHGYLICLLTFLMIFFPMDRALSVAARRKPGYARKTLPAWPRAAILGQIGLVYTYGAIAKINEDWLVYYMPIRRWLENSAKNAPIGAELITSSWFTPLVAWGGCAFDLLVFPALLWRRSRPVAIVLSAGFHLTNAFLFNIGVFPWLMLAITTLFLDPDWPRRIPVLGRRIAALVDRGSDDAAPTPQRRRLITAGLAVWFSIQMLLPLRHHLYPGNVAWTEEGHLYSWRMKLRSKRGWVSFRARNPETGHTEVVDPNDDLSARQVRKMGGRPELMLQYAQFIAERFRAEDNVEVEVYADAWVSLNFRRRQRLVDPEVDLARESARWGHYPWILPLAPAPPPTD